MSGAQTPLRLAAVLVHERAAKDWGAERVRQIVEALLGADRIVLWYETRNRSSRLRTYPIGQSPTARDLEESSWEAGVARMRQRLVTELCYFEGDDGLWEMSGEVDEELGGPLPLLAHRLLSLDFLRRLILIRIRDDATSILSVRLEAEPKPRFPAWLTAATPAERLFLLGRIVDELEESAAAKPFVQNYFKVLNRLCNNDSLYLPQELSPEHTPVLQWYADGANAEMAGLSDSGEKLPRAHNQLAGTFTRLLPIIHQLRKFWGVFSDVAAACPLETSDESLSRSAATGPPKQLFREFLRGFRLADGRVAASEVALNLAYIVRWFLYTYAGAVHLDLLAHARAAQGELGKALQYAVNSFDTYRWTCWCSAAVVFRIQQNNAIADKVPAIRFGPNGVETRPGDWSRPRKGVAGKCFDTLYQLDHDFHQAISPLRNRSPLSHGFMVRIDPEKLNQALDYLHEIQDRSVKELAKVTGLTTRALEMTRHDIEPADELFDAISYELGTLQSLEEALREALSTPIPRWTKVELSSVLSQLVWLTFILRFCEVQSLSSKQPH